MPEGFVYILTSPNSPFVKIGGTEHPPTIRLRSIEATDTYGAHGPWGISDFRQVTDWREAERILHTAFGEQRIQEIAGARELFGVDVATARERLAALNTTLLVRQDQVDLMFQDRAFALYLEKLFRFAGLASWLHTQGAWTLRLFPSTAGGRYFTLNIGGHEVAYSTLPRGDGNLPTHAVVVDRLIGDFPDVVDWLGRMNGRIEPAPYKSAYDRATSVSFHADFATAEHLFSLSGVRRALMAYWSEALVDLHERDAQSVHGRFHDYNAVARLMAQIRNRPLF